MANLRIIRRRIIGVRNTRQLTRAMKMVAAAKLRRSQERVEGGRPYMKMLREMIVLVKQGSSGAGDQFNPLSGDGKACLVFTSDRGLCGSYNSNVIKAALQLRREKPETRFIVFGKKGIDAFRKRNFQTFLTFPEFFPKFNWENSAKVIEQILQDCRRENVGELSAIYTHFVSAGVQRLSRGVIFPFTVDAGTTAKPTSGEILIEPDANIVLASLVELYARFTFFHIAAEVIASENGARMTAMDAATKNAKEMIDRLTLEMNRARQATITKELLEIISGAEALEK